MTQSYSQIVKQIEALRRKADAARNKEIAGVIGRIKEAISFYGLTAGELGLAKGAEPGTATQRVQARSGGAAKSKSKFGDAAKYRDANGNEWVGRGPRPIWLREALKNGKALSDFAISGESSDPTAAKASRKKAGKRAKKASVAKYKDDSGKTWSGRGRKPAWFVKALADGKSLESLSA